MADELSAGLYETVLTESLVTRLAEVAAELIEKQGLRSADAADRIAQLLARQVLQALESVPRDDRVAIGVEVAQLLTRALHDRLPKAGVAAEHPVEPGSILTAVGEWLPDGSVHVPARPLIPLLDTTLLTNAPGEPRVGLQVLQEIESADAIDVVMAFVRKSGIRPLLTALRRHAEHGRRLRVLTTTYTASTEASALDQLADLGAEVRVSYDTTITRLHAKAWLFHRNTSFSTAYVGSSNLTHSAQTAGLEWNVRVSAARNPDVIDKISAVFESYWQSGDFVDYHREQFVESLVCARLWGQAVWQEGRILPSAGAYERGHRRREIGRWPAGLGSTGTGGSASARSQGRAGPRLSDRSSAVERGKLGCLPRRLAVPSTRTRTTTSETSF